MAHFILLFGTSPIFPANSKSYILDFRNKRKENGKFPPKEFLNVCEYFSNNGDYFIAERSLPMNSLMELDSIHLATTTRSCS